MSLNDGRSIGVDAVTLMTMECDPIKLIISPWLESPSINLVHAPRGIGKTYFALKLAYAASTGSDLY